MTAYQDRSVSVVGLVIAIRTLMTKRGGKMAFITLEDSSGRAELIVFSDVYEAQKDILVKDAIVLVEGEASLDEYTGGVKLNVRRALTIETMRATYAKRVCLRLEASRVDEKLVFGLRVALEPFCTSGTCPVQIYYQRPDSAAEIVLGQAWRVSPTDALLKQLRSVVGAEQVSVEY